jgi:hypothetical protein
MLRDKKDRPGMNGIWIATTHEHQNNLKSEYSSLVPIVAYADETMQTGWQCFQQMPRILSLLQSGFMN